MNDRSIWGWMMVIWLVMAISVLVIKYALHNFSHPSIFFSCIIMSMLCNIRMRQG